MPRGNSARWCIDRTMTQLQSTTTEQAGTTCLIAADCGDAGLEVVADDRLRHAADHVQGVDVRSDPSRKTQALVHVTYQAVGVRLRIRPRAGARHFEGAGGVRAARRPLRARGRNRRRTRNHGRGPGAGKTDGCARARSLRAPHRRGRRTHRAGSAADGPHHRQSRPGEPRRLPVQAALGVVYEHHFACAQKAL
jgi:hypothetical protein